MATELLHLHGKLPDADKLKQEQSLNPVLQYLNNYVSFFKRLCPQILSVVDISKQNDLLKTFSVATTLVIHSVSSCLNSNKFLGQKDLMKLIDDNLKIPDCTFEELLCLYMCSQPTREMLDSWIKVDIENIIPELTCQDHDAENLLAEVRNMKRSYIKSTLTEKEMLSRQFGFFTELRTYALKNSNLCDVSVNQVLNSLVTSAGTAEGITVCPKHDFFTPLLCKSVWHDGILLLNLDTG